MKQSSLIVNGLKSAIKTIVGSCQSSGILVDGEDARVILKEIDEGKFDSLINSEVTEPSEDKKKKLSVISNDLIVKVKEREKQKAAAKVEAEAKAAAKAAAGTTPAAPSAKSEVIKTLVKK